MPNYDPELDDAVITESKQKVEKPPLYKVLLHNDNYTTMDFVVVILIRVFHQSEGDAIRIMLQVHNKGMGVAGVFTREIAETKVGQVTQLAQQHEFPLLCTMEEE
jgi:ATP-dependent Clp protease adaptor protein ClpS